MPRSTADPETCRPRRACALRCEGGSDGPSPTVPCRPVPPELRIRVGVCQRETATDKWFAPGMLRLSTTAGVEAPSPRPGNARPHGTPGVACYEAAGRSCQACARGAVW